MRVARLVCDIGVGRGVEAYLCSFTVVRCLNTGRVRSVQEKGVVSRICEFETDAV